MDVQISAPKANEFNFTIRLCTNLFNIFVDSRRTTPPIAMPSCICLRHLRMRWESKLAVFWISMAGRWHFLLGQFRPIFRAKLAVSFRSLYLLIYIGHPDRNLATLSIKKVGWFHPLNRNLIPFPSVIPCDLLVSLFTFSTSAMNLFEAVMLSNGKL